MVTRRLILARKNWRLWIFASVVFLGSLLGYLQLQGIQTGHSGDMLCGGDIVCEGYFWINVPPSVTNYLGEKVDITQLCFGRKLEVQLSEPKVENLKLYKADRRYREDNPARWTKEWSFTGNCLSVGNHSFMINGTKDRYSTVKWAIKNTGIDPLWLGEKPKGVIGTVGEAERIEIISQTFIDQYIGFEFSKIDNNTWSADFSIDPEFFTDLKKTLPYACSNFRWRDLRDKYLSGFAITKTCSDIKNMTNYPLRNLTKDISFSDFNINLTSGTGSFTINFPDGFKSDEYADLGFGTTSIGTTTSIVPFDAYSRAVCRTTNRIHAVWRGDTTGGVRISYTNSTDGETWNTAINLDGSSSIDNTAGNAVPSIACNGNNVFVAWNNITSGSSGLYYMNSTDEGGTWSSYIGNAAPRMAIISGTGNFFNTVGGISFGTNGNVWITYNNDSGTQEQIWIANSSSYGGDLPTITAKQLTEDWGGNGYVSIYVNVTDGNEGVWVATSSATDNNLYFNWTANGGSTWSGSIIQSGTFTRPSLTLFNGTFYVVNECCSTGGMDIEIWNTTNPTVIGWGNATIYVATSTTDDARFPVVTNTSNNLYVFYNNENGTDNRYDVQYQMWNITNGWTSKTLFDKTGSGTGHANVNINSMNGTAVDILFANETVTDTVYYGVVNEVPVTADITPPTFSNMKANTTVAGNPVNFSVVITDETALSGYIFETNNTGNYVNTTWVSLASGGTASNITTLNSTVGANASWNFYANDTSNNWAVARNNTVTTSADTCTYSSGNWNVNCADNCVISSVVNVGNNNINITGTGTFRMTADVKNFNKLTISGSCRVTCNGGCFR